MSTLLELIGGTLLVVSLAAVNPALVIALFGALLIAIGYRRGDNQ
jgi:hypothetical protein